MSNADMTKGIVGEYRTTSLNVPAMMTSAELSQLATWASRHKRIVEIGSWQGGSTRVMADATPGSIIAVDNFTGCVGYEVEGGLAAAFYRHLGDHIASGKVVHWWMAHGEAPKFMPINFLDMAMIDGNHAYEAVKHDITQWLPKIESGGILTGHDYHPRCPGVIQAVDELLPGFKIAVDSLWYTVKG